MTEEYEKNAEKTVDCCRQRADEDRAEKKCKRMYNMQIVEKNFHTIVEE